MPDITLITPTGDRPVMFAICEWLMSRQKYRGTYQWIVVDDGVTPTKTTMGQQLIRRANNQTGKITPDTHSVGSNLLSALIHVDAPKVLVIEDDDFYGADYLARMDDLLEIHDLVGEAGSKYYRLTDLRYQFFKNGAYQHRAALARTGFSAGLSDQIAGCCHGDFEVDNRIWATVQANKALLKPSESSGLHVGIKGGPGRTSPNHRHSLIDGIDSGYILPKLTEWTRDLQAVDLYRHLIEGMRNANDFTRVTEWIQANSWGR